MVKTIVVRRGEGDYLFVLVPGDRVISWPKLRALLGVSRLSMPPPPTPSRHRLRARHDHAVRLDVAVAGGRRRAAGRAGDHARRGRARRRGRRVRRRRGTSPRCDRCGRVGPRLTYGRSMTDPSREERNAPPPTLVIFGASGDLTRRKLLPAVESLARHNRLPGEFAAGRRRPHADERRPVRGRARSATAASPTSRSCGGGIRYVVRRLRRPGDLQAARRGARRAGRRSRGTAGNRLFYLSTPAEAFEPVINGLAGAGLNQRRARARSPGW